MVLKGIRGVTLIIPIQTMGQPVARRRDLSAQLTLYRGSTPWGSTD